MKAFLEVTPRGGFPYPVLLGAGTEAICAELERRWDPTWHSAVLVADETTFALFGAAIESALAARGVPVVVCTFPPGEQSKTRATKAAMEDRMLAEGCDRNTCVVGVGGGIVLDVAGFVAATFMRGVAHINVATTLLAQVDAAIGGKTAVNTDHGKNLVGAIHHPRAVLLDTGALTSLPDVELRCGLAEAVKHAVLSDASLFERLEAWPLGTLIPPLDILTRCVAIKAEVIADDDRDRGRRNILNYGHTVAHAIEHATKHTLPHGLAVAIGMVVEARAALGEGRFPEGDLARLIALLERLGLPTQPPCDFESASAFLARDKKTVAGEIRCALPACIGRTLPESDGSWTRAVSSAQLRGAW